MTSPRYESVRGIIADIMQVPIDLVGLDSTNENLQGWDSLSHLNLMMALENEFEVAFDKNEVMDCLSLISIVSLLDAKIDGPEPKIAGAAN